MTINSAVLPANIAYPNTFDPRSFGAIGNGRSNPANTKYSTLSALQGVYGTTLSGVTVTLNQELDWLGTQKAINAAQAAGGGTIYSSGSFIYSNRFSASDGSGTLVFPEANPFDPIGGVSWVGDFPGSKHRWPSDLGSGRFAVLCGGRGRIASAGSFSGLMLMGPGCGLVRGVSNCQMQGIGTNDRRAISSSYIYGFRVGINVVGGQFNHTDIFILGNYYAYYFDQPDPNNYGNMQFTRVVCNGSLMATIGIHHAAQLGDSMFLSCFLGTAPFGVYKETNSGSPANARGASNMVFDLCQFEAMGNAVVGEDTAGPTTRVSEIFNTKFRNTEFNWTPGGDDILPGVPAYAAFDVGGIEGLYIEGPSTEWFLHPGTVGIINCRKLYHGVRIQGNVNTLISNCVNAQPPRKNMFFGGNAGGPSGIVLEQTIGTPWKGTVAFSRVPARVGSVIVQAPNTAIDHFNLSTGSATDVPLGVLMYNPTPSSPYQYCIYADEGNGIMVNTSGTVTIGQALRTGSNGTAVAAGGSSTSPIIGIAMSNAVNGQCMMKLQGLR